LRIAVEGGMLRILQEGVARKFEPEVEHRTFSGEYAVKRAQPVLFVTERCVLRLTGRGMELVEIAPGMDLERDILAQMDFVPVIDSPPRLMDARIFQNRPMGLRDDLAAALHP
ncbi:MAG: acyl CoA:acetate/3-ketoacid CoA transferase, partial [bacterium]